MSSAEPVSPTTQEAIRAVEDACSASAGLLEANQIDALPPRTIQRLVSTAVKLYMAKREAGCAFDPV